MAMYEQVLSILCHAIIMIGSVTILCAAVWAFVKIVGKMVFRITTVKTTIGWFLKYRYELKEFESILDEHMNRKMDGGSEE